MKKRDHIHTVVISYQRLELTKQTIHSYMDTVTLPYTLVVVDNASDEATCEWLENDAWVDDYNVIFLPINRYPGFATNRGWETAPPQTTLLHRSDNDFKFLPGWCDQVLAVLENKSIGQVGLRTGEEELWNDHNVGGNNVIRRKLWDKGLRYDERAWGDGYDPGWTEDSLLSPAVVRLGYRWGRVAEPCIQSLSYEDPSDPYYQASWAARGIKPPA